MVIQHNLEAVNASRIYKLTDFSTAKAAEKLGSGYKINRGADDAAGLAISEKMRRQVRGLSQASVNAQDGISMVQTVEGSLGEIHELLQRMNELTIQGANDTLEKGDREYIDNEIAELKLEIDRVGETNVFNEIHLLDGEKEENVTAAAPNISGVSGTLTPATADEPAKYKLNAPIQEGDVVGVTSASGTKYYKVGDQAGSGDGSSASNAIGTTKNVIYGQIAESLLDANKTANPDADIVSTYYRTSGAEEGEFTIRFQKPLNVKLQVGTEQGTDQTVTFDINPMNSGTLGIHSANVSTSESARESIGLIKNALKSVSEERSKLGSIQNRLEHTISNLDNAGENTTAAESRIRDADMAKAMVDYSIKKIMMHTGESMMATANQSKDGVMKMLA